MSTTIRIPRAHKKRLKAFDSLPDVNRWGSDIDARIVEILQSLGDTQRAIRDITRSTGAASIGLHAANHRPATGLDPLATAAPISILGGTSSNSIGVGNSFARNDHSHDVATAAWTGAYSASAAAEGTGNALLRADATLLAPTFLRTAFSNSSITASDDGTDQTLLGNLGLLNIRSATEIISLDKWTGGGDQTGIVGKVLSFLARTVNIGTTLTHGVHSQITFDTAVTYTGATHRSIEAQLNQASTTVTYTNETAQALRSQLTFTSYGAAANSWTEIGGYSNVVSCPTGSGTTITDIYGHRVSGWPTLGTGGTITNAYGERIMLPTLGATIRRGVWVDPSSTANLGTEAANVEGFYCGALPRGTAQRSSFYALGATTGTPTMVVGFYAAAHGVGTTKWSFYANNESRMAGVQQDDNAKDAFGTGRDAEVYYDGTDLIIDPDVVGSGEARIAGKAHVTGETEMDGALNHDGTAVGFYATAPATQQTVTGSRGGNAALASLLTALALTGLIVDGSSA